MNGMKSWHAIYTVLDRAMKWSVYVAVFCSAVILVASVVDVIGSKFFNQGLPGATAFVEELNLVLVFMAIAYVQIERGHLNINMFTRLMSPVLRHVVTLSGYVLGILACGFFSWRTLVLMQNMIATHDIKNAAVVEFPLWPFALVNFYGYAMLTLAFILCLGKGIMAGAKK